MAVVAVLLFHARYEWFVGGFVGVDVFFVISGFVITRSIFRHWNDPGFLWGFYERRIRRIVPPIIPVLIFTTAFVYVLSPPDALDEYARTLIAFVTFWSNLFFLWFSGDYFDGPEQYKPLLHTWSLSIEEQFYIVFPAAVLFLRRSRATAFVATVFCLSLAIYVWLSLTDGKPYFNSLARFWEIALGSLLAFGVVKSPERGKTALGLIGLAAILFAIFAFDKDTPLFAILPTFGAAAIILTNGGPVARLLSLKPVVGVGLISYAMYLWHWPIFVFIDLVQPNPTPLHFAAGIAVAVALSVVSYHLIEMPIMRKKAFPTRRAAYALFASVGSLFIALGVTGTATGGLPARFPQTAADYDKWLKAGLNEWWRTVVTTGCLAGGNGPLDAAVSKCVGPEEGHQNILLLGDSHAAQLFLGFRHAFPDANVDLIGSNGCDLVPGRKGCEQLLQWIDADLAKLRYDLVVVTARAPTPAISAAYAETVARIADIAPTVVFGPVPFYNPDMPMLYSTSVGKLATSEISNRFAAAIQPMQFELDGLLKERLSGQNYISLIDHYCPEGPRTCQFFDGGGRPLYLDRTHLTPTAARELITALKPRLEKFLSVPSG